MDTVFVCPLHEDETICIASTKLCQHLRESHSDIVIDKLDQVRLILPEYVSLKCRSNNKFWGQDTELRNQLMHSKLSKQLDKQVEELSMMSDW